jgi:predicted RNA binding protein YcfA (HicA-like mRNA interferase family)
VLAHVGLDAFNLGDAGWLFSRPLSRCPSGSEILELLKRDGWYVARMRGSHRQFKHRAKAGLVTVAGKPADDLAPGTLNSILKQAGLKK